MKRVHGEVKPRDGAPWWRTSTIGRKVAMAGGGINDAPALAQLGIAVRYRDRDERAAHTLVEGDLMGILRARALSVATVNMRQNLGFAFLYNSMVPRACSIRGAPSVSNDCRVSHERQFCVCSFSML